MSNDEVIDITPISNDSPDDLTPKPVITNITPPSTRIPPDSADEQDDVVAPTVMKKGAGRPKVDGTPNKTATEAPMKTPYPPHKRYYSDAVRVDQRPLAFLTKWYPEIPTWAKKRLIFYVYRKWPVLNPVAEDLKAARLDFTYIDKLEEPPTSLQALEDKYGAGDYSIVCNDDVVDKRTIAEIDVRENFRDFASHPPTDRRIDNAENVSLEDPSNRAYIQYLRGKGKLPEQQAIKGREADMAEATALKEMTGFMREVVSKSMDKRDDRGTNDTTATVVKEIMGVMGEVNKQAASVMENAYKKTQEDRYVPPPQTDPLETLTRVLAVVKELKSENSGGSDSEVVKLLLGQINKQNERMEEMFKEFKNAGQPQTQAVAPNPLSTTKDTLETILGIAATMGLKAGGGAAAAAAETGSWWKDNLPELMQYGSQAIGSITNVITTKMQIDARMAQGQTYQPTPPPPSNQYVQALQIPQAQTSTIEPIPVVDAAPEPTEEQKQELNQFLQFMASIHEPLMNHIDQDLGGDRFAEWLIDSKRDGAAIYKQIKLGGKDSLLQGLKMYAPLWSELEPKASLLDKFMDDFMNMEEIRAAEMEAESDNNEEDEDPDDGEESEGAKTVKAN